MSRKKMKRSANPSQSAMCWLASSDAFADLCVNGYTSLDRNPEIVSACKTIADIISSMTIYLMANTEHGDRRIINELSRLVDINPTSYMTRKTWMSAIVMNLLLYGQGNSVVFPHTEDGFLRDLEPIPSNRVSFLPSGNKYKVIIDGMEFDPKELLHFVYNPDPLYLWKGQGLQTALRDVANNLKQAAATEKGFLSSKWKPSVIVKVDALTDEFASPSGRQKLLDSYINTAEVGQPWLIPAEQFSVEQIKPLSLSDLALNDMVQLDKRTVAAVLGVPPFVLGIGEYNSEAWNAFINNTVKPIARGIEQELTKKLLVSPKMYWRFNIASLYSYDISATAKVYSDLFVKGIVTGNEVRNKVGMEPLEGLDHLVILENYIPLEKVGDQLKLKQEE